jgi:hypothetical protein
MTQPIYYRWAYSPSTGDVTLSHNHEGHPADITFHSQMAEQRPEGDLQFGYAYKLDNGWKVTNDKHQPESDVHLRVAVENAIEEQGFQKTAYDYESADQKWAWVEGVGSETWKDSEIGGEDYEPGEHTINQNMRAENPDWNTDDINEAWQDGLAEDYADSNIRAHFVVLTELASRHPALKEDAIQDKVGLSYGALDYSTVAKSLNDAGIKWAIGMMMMPDYDLHTGEEKYVLDIGAHGPTTTPQDVQAIVGEGIEVTETSGYGLQGYQKWEEDDYLWDDDPVEAQETPIESKPGQMRLFTKTRYGQPIERLYERSSESKEVIPYRPNPTVSD